MFCSYVGSGTAKQTRIATSTSSSCSSRQYMQRDKKESLFDVLLPFGLLGVFKSVSVHFHRKGHTHGPIDQRFSVLATVVARQRILQTLSCFVDAILQFMRAARRRLLFCVVCRGTYDWQAWLSSLGVGTPGITPNPWTNELHTNHCWRIMRRCDLPSQDQSHGEEWQPIELMPGGAHENDAIVLFKEWESSQQLSQRPLVVLPYVQSLRLCGTEPCTNARDTLGDRSVKEFRKTADIIAKKPWALHKAAEWLLSWTKSNRDGTTPTLPSASEEFPIIFDREDRVAKEAGSGVCADPIGWRQFAPMEIRIRSVAANLKVPEPSKSSAAASMKRPAAAPSSPNRGQDVWSNQWKSHPKYSRGLFTQYML